jgi:AcrR family transcriptional regulator
VTPSEVAEARRLGRPRSAACDAAILDAAIELFVEIGYEGFTMEAAAARAGVGKATLYRRYGTKLELVMAAAQRLGEQKGPIPDTGAVREDLLGLARGYRRMLTATDAGRAFPAMLAAKARHPELERAHTRFVSERRRASFVVVTRATERGELPAGTDPGLLVDLLHAPLFYRVFVSGEPVTDRYLLQLVDSVLAGARG